MENNKKKIRYYREKQLDEIPQLKKVGEEKLEEMKIVSSILPFKVNNYVIENLINWDRVEDDPIFNLAFPCRKMLSKEHFKKARQIYYSNMNLIEKKEAITKIHLELNPHPASQQEKNVPTLDGKRIEGIQHKYKETALIFPKLGQTCHSHCTFCFRWPQFVGNNTLQFASNDAHQLKDYLAQHQEITDVLITGGDPVIMKTKHLEMYVNVLLSDELEHIKNIRIGTKAITFWPYRFTEDRDADGLLNLLEKIVSSGKHLAIMAHFNHKKEFENAEAIKAIKQIQKTGAVIRTQTPIVKHINANSETLAEMWQSQVQLGMVPYYLFVERDTGAKLFFELPLAEAYKIYRDAISKVSGLAKTVRGPSMSASPGKVHIDGIAKIGDEKVFVLRLIQARDPKWNNRPFFAKYSKTATWLDQLTPAFGKKRFFFEENKF